jgi:hypothetical protein
MGRGRKGRLPDEIRRDCAEIAKLYCEGKTQAEIGHRLNLSQQQVSHDLKAIRAEWLESSIRDFDTAKAQELAKIDHVEAEAWKGWEKSRLDKEITISGTEEADGTVKNKAQVRKEGQAGDPRFLETVHRCIERRCKLLGLDPPERRELTGANGQPLFSVEAAVAADKEADREIESWKHERFPRNGATPAGSSQVS